MFHFIYPLDLKVLCSTYCLIFILLSLTACSSTDKEEKNEDSSIALMRDLEKYQFAGDTVHYKFQRKKIEETIQRDKNLKLELYLETHDGVKAVNNGDLVLGKERLTKTFEKAEKQNESLNDYAHMISHDLKSPLRSIHALISWIKEDNPNAFNANTLDYLNKI